MSETPDVEALVEELRGHADDCPRCSAALDSLTAALERAERERDEWKHEADHWAGRKSELLARAQKAEAVVATMRDLAVDSDPRIREIARAALASLDEQEQA